MSRTITAFFDSRSEAEAARQRLTQSRIDADNVRIVDQSSTATSGSHEQGLWASIKEAFMPAEDSHAYEEGMRRGGFLVCASVDEDEADEAVRLLDEASSVDFDERQNEWRNDGWQGFTGMTDTGVPSGAGMGASGYGVAASAGAGMGIDTDRTLAEERIPIVEEELKVGKREVTRGGARVRSYVREVPVHESISLREEHVSVERRPVDETLRAGDLDARDLLRDREIEMTETAEEAVVAKDARVVEEVVVRKTADQHVENIDDTVRRTEVEVDEGRSALFGKDRTTGASDSTGGGTSADLERSDRDRF